MIKINTPQLAMPKLLIGIDGNEANVTNRVGSNVYAYQLLKALYEIKSHHKFVIYLKEPPRSDFPTPHENWLYKILPMKKLWSQIRLPWEIIWSNNKPDIFWAPGHYVSPLLPCPVVITILDTAYLTHPEFFRKQDLYQLRTWTQRSVNKSKHILTISQSSKNDILDHYSVKDEDITVTYPGIDHEKYYFPQQDNEINRVKQHFGIKDNYLLYVGTLQPRKNLERLIESFANLKLESYQLVIAGKKGWMYDSIFELVSKLNLTNRIIFTDFVKSEDLPPLMAGARATVLISLYEGFGIPVAESLAVGTPCVVSGISSLPEVLGSCGIKVDPYNIDQISKAIKKIIDLTPIQYTHLVDKGIKHAQLFKWDRVAMQTLSVLEQVGLQRV